MELAARLVSQITRLALCLDFLAAGDFGLLLRLFLQGVLGRPFFQSSTVGFRIAWELVRLRLSANIFAQVGRRLVFGLQVSSGLLGGFAGLGRGLGFSGSSGNLGFSLGLGLLRGLENAILEAVFLDPLPLVVDVWAV